MAAVLPRSAAELGPFRHELSAPPIIPEPAYSVNLFERYSPASFAMYNSGYSPHHPSLDSKRASQPCSSPHVELRRPLSPSSASRSASTTPLCRPSSPLVSAHGMIVVLDYTPSEGEADTPVTVNLELRSRAGDDKDDFGQDMSLTGLRLRLVFGRTAVRTTVNRSPPMSLAGVKDEPERKGLLRLQLRASAPSYTETRFPEQFSVPLTIQAMDGSTEVVESFTFGSFTYWAPTTIRPTAMVGINQLPEATSPTKNKRKRLEEDADPYSQSSQSESPPEFSSPKKALVSPPQPDKGFRLVRTTNISTEALNGAEAQPASLEWVVEDGLQHPSSLDKRWSQHELAVGRRLIRFGRELSGNKLRVSCEVIPQEAYDEEHIVISCVYRQETRNCWFTSVDVIYLLERLVGGPFSVEEKNRIRRNLEGFKPTTVSKTKGGFEMFFQRIMDFPPPKPRNIEKDVKVFPWQLLAPAVDKIISKYSVIPTSDSESSPVSQESSSNSSSSQHRLTRSGRSRSTSTHSQVPVPKEDQSFGKPLKSASSQQSLHMVVESPQIIHPDLAAHIPEPNSMQAPMDHYYFPGLNFGEEDQWRRRDSIISLDSMPSQTHDYYPGHEPNELHATPGALHSQAFSNPFASDVNFGSLSLGGAGHHGHGLDVHPADMHAGAHDGTVPFESDFAADHVFESRRSSLASELMYPMSESPAANGNGTAHDAMTAVYDAVNAQDAAHHGPGPNDYLYAPFHAGSHHRLPLEDVHP